MRPVVRVSLTGQDDAVPHPAPLFNRDDLDSAIRIVRRHVTPTPTVRWPLLDATVGARVWVKHENCTPTGAFKIRGGLVFVERLRERRPEVRGLVSATVGNHGLSLSMAGRNAGLDVLIVVPEGSDPDRIAAMEAVGATVIVHGPDFEAARRHSLDLATDGARELVPPFHPDLALGVATYALELFEAAGPLDAVFVPVGMGSGICGLATVRDLLGLETRVIGVGAEGAPAQRLTFEAGRVVATDRVDTFAAGVAVRQPDPMASEVIRRAAESVVPVPDAATADAIRLLWRTTHHLAEPAGAIATAALLAQRERWRGRSVGVVLSGSIMEPELAATVLGDAS